MSPDDLPDFGTDGLAAGSVDALIDDLPLDLDESTQTRSVDRSAMLHENSEGFGHKSRKLTTGAGGLDPFLRIEEFWIQEAAIAPVPLAGTILLNYVFEDSETGLMIRDSIGGQHVIPAGALFVISTGSGIVVEQTPELYGLVCHGVSVTINLACADKDVAPTKVGVPAKAVRELVRGALMRVRVLAGASSGLTATFMPGTPFTLVEAHLSPGASLRHELPRDHTAFAVVLRGRALVGTSEDPRSVRAGVAVSLFDDGDSVLVRAADEKCHVLVGSGKPLAETVFTEAGFVMNHPQELADAQARFDSGEMGLLSPRE